MLTFVVSSCRLQGSASKLNVPLKIWIGMGHKTCTLWHEVYVRHPSTCTAAAAIAVSVVSLCVWLPWALDLHHMYTCTVSPANNPSHRYHGGCNVTAPQFSMLHTVELSKFPTTSPGGRLLTRLWIGVCSPGWQTFTLPRQNFPTLSSKKKGKITTIARISVACYWVMVQQQSEYTHNSKFRWHTCLVCQPPWSEPATLTVNSSGCSTHQGNSLDTLNWSVYRGYYM